MAESPEPMPLYQHALVASGPGQLRLVSDKGIPRLESDQILIKTKAVALNPADWKLLDFSTTPGAVSGCEFAGIVLEVGDKVRKAFRAGDRVCGMIFGANPARPADGAFAEYVTAVGDLCLPIPSWMSFEEAASISVALVAAGLAFRSLGIHVKDSETGINQVLNTESSHVLVYGGSTATGSLAIQLLRLFGYLPVATCSPHNFDLVKKAGAVAEFDYHSTTCAEEIRELTGGKLAYALDCITDRRSMTVCYGAIGSTGGRYTALEPFPARLHNRRRNIEPDWILGWTIFGKAVDLNGVYRRDDLPADYVFGVEWLAAIEPFLAEGKLRPHPIQVKHGGLAHIIPDLEILRRGKVSGKKLIYTL
ncbi:MAG: hypothetical protein Q9195_007669 [Heterodermia aff. obscurata]